MRVKGPFTQKKFYENNTFNTSYFSDDLYIISVRSSYLGNFSILQKCDTNDYRAGIIHSDAKIALLLINDTGFQLFGDVSELTELLVFQLNIK